MIVQGSLLTSRCKYIAHQCNCISQNALGLAQNIFEKFPYSNVYKGRGVHKSTPGTISIHGNGNDERYVINMFSQFYPGKPKPPRDSKEKRLEWFENCLKDISEIPNLTSIGFPYKIGCGLAQGNWDKYLKKLEEFQKRTDAWVVIYKL